MIKIVILVASLMHLFISETPGGVNQTDDKSLLHIEFQTNFKIDTISVKINNVSIVNDVVITSTYNGDTDLSLKISADKYSRYKIQYLNRLKYCNRSNYIKIALKLNRKESIYLVNPNNGKWVGIGKDYDKSFSFTQQKTAFVYE